MSDLHTCRRQAQKGLLERQLHSLFGTSCPQHGHQAACGVKLNQVFKPTDCKQGLAVCPACVQ